VIGGEITKKERKNQRGREKIYIFSPRFSLAAFAANREDWPHAMV